MRVHAVGIAPMTDSPSPRPLTCPRCGTSFECRPEGGCWCSDESFRLPLDAAAVAEGCLCPACLRQAAEAARRRRNIA